MDNISVYFFWPGLLISIILSVLLTIGLNLWTRRKYAGRESYDFDEDSRHAFNDKNGRKTGHDFEETGKTNETNQANEANKTRTDMSGMIMIGPIPIAFGSGGVRIDRKAFKYALLFFIIVILIWWTLVQTVRL